MTKEVTITDNFLNLIEKVAMSKDVDVEKMNAILDMQERILDKNSKLAFDKDMAELHPKIPQIHADSKAHNSKYAKYEKIDKIVRPFYTDFGFSPAFNSKKEQDNSTTYYGILSHKEGHSKTYEINLKDDTSGSKNIVQAKASTLSYAKRYLIQMMFNIVTTGEDIDGNTFLEENKVRELNDLIKNTDSDKVRFLKVMGVKQITDIIDRDYDKAKNALQSKQRAILAKELD